MAKTTGQELITDLTSGVYRRQFSGFIRGRRINSITIEGEAWFWRFHGAADDFGNAEADPIVAYTNTVGRREGVTPAMVQDWLKESCDIDLLRIYKVGAEIFYHVVGWHARQPAGKNGKRVRRVPASPWDDNDEPKPPDSFFQVNPGATSASDSDSDSDSHSDTDAREVVVPPATPEEVERARAEASAVSFAKNWITAECPNFLRSGPAPFSRLIMRLGKKRAIAEVQTARRDPNVGNPFAYLETKLDNIHARKQAAPAAAAAGARRKDE